MVGGVYGGGGSDGVVVVRVEVMILRLVVMRVEVMMLGLVLMVGW